MKEKYLLIEDMENLCYNCYHRKSYQKCGCKEECDKLEGNTNQE